jgi:hypothetical protein
MWHPEAARLLMLRGPIFERVPTVSNASPWVGARALTDQACEQRSTPQERGPEGAVCLQSSDAAWRDPSAQGGGVLRLIEHR